MIDIDNIKQAFTSPDGERLIALDWNKDIAPMLNGHGEVQFHTLQGDEIEDVMKSFLALPSLNDATDIVFNLSVREPYCCKMWQMALYANELCVIPSWDHTHAPNQPVNIKIDILYKYGA